MKRSDSTGPMRAFIKKGARFFLNGALMRASDSVTLDIHAVDVLLMPSHLIDAEEVHTPLQQLYYCVQQMLIAPERKAEWQEGLRSCVAGAGLPDREVLRPVLRLVEREKYQSAMAQLRKVMREERDSQSRGTEATSRRV
ncbi:flagellar biosynthesis repressor FlbT [Methylobacterium sp. ID0610]|uniref:flagellar biosynthesis repressor FlbT n=1 Tax=Methylobacterium carpenticola TaxID=3344827 RepID=UPI0036993BF9